MQFRVLQNRKACSILSGSQLGIASQAVSPTGGPMRDRATKHISRGFEIRHCQLDKPQRLIGSALGNQCSSKLISGSLHSAKGVVAYFQRRPQVKRVLEDRQRLIEAAGAGPAVRASRCSNR